MTEQEARTREILKQRTVHYGPCAKCDGERLVTTGHGLKHCECYFRYQTAEVAPRLIRGSDTLWDGSLLVHEPWSVALDRRDVGGSFDLWRHMVWRSLAAARYAEYLAGRPNTFRTDAIFTYEALDASFQRHETYSNLSQLSGPSLPLLILIEGIDPAYYHESIRQILRAIIPARRARGLATWLYRLNTAAEIFQSPALQDVVKGLPLPPAYPVDIPALPGTSLPQLAAGDTDLDPDEAPATLNGRVNPNLL